MGSLLTRAFRRPEQRAIPTHPFLTDSEHVTYGRTAAGRTVTQDQALRLIAVYACVNLIADSVAQMPASTYRKRGDVREETTPPLWLNPIDWQPNPETDLYTHTHRTINSILLHGTGYQLITARDRLGYPTEVWTLDPRNLTPDRTRGGLRYRWHSDYLTPYSRANPSGDLLVIKGFDAGGDVGLSPIAAAREGIGLGLAAEEHGARWFGGGAVPPGVIQHPGSPNNDQLSVMREAWAEHHSGGDRVGRPGILTGGATWQTITVPLEDQQWIEARRFQTNEIARLYRVPPHLVSDVERSTSWGTGIEEQNIGFVTYTLLPWMRRLETAWSRLLPRAQYVKLNPAALLRGSVAARYQAYATALQNGWASRNEVRAWEDLNPVDGLDELLQPLNLGPTDPEGTPA